MISASFSLDKIHDELWDFRSPNEDEARGVFDSFFPDSEGDFDNELGDAFKKDNHHGELCQDACPLYASDLGFTECFKIFGKGYAHDLCPYMRTYFGSVILNRYAFGGSFPKPDFLWQTHICCSHSKWFQNVSDLLGCVPLFSIDVSVGPNRDLKPHALEYVVSQMHEGIEWLEKVTGRTYDDERLIEAVYNHCEVSSLWAEVCTLNKAIPAPLDEKSMLSLSLSLQSGGIDQGFQGDGGLLQGRSR